MKFRPCIDIHNGKVKQIVGSSLKDEGNEARENFVAQQDAEDEEEDGGITFEEIGDYKEDEEDFSHESAQNQSVPDMSEIIAMVRAEVEREMSKKLQDLAATGAVSIDSEESLDDFYDIRTQETEDDIASETSYDLSDDDDFANDDIDIADEEEAETDEEVWETDDETEDTFTEDEEPEEDEDEETEADEEDDGSFIFEDVEDDDDDFVFGLDSEEDTEEEEDNEEDDDDGGFELKFDIDAILDEQLESYNAMSITQRMAEIDVQTMEISFDDLTAYIRDMRKSRRS